MTSITLFINNTQKIGPLQVWPLKVTGVSHHAYKVPPIPSNLIITEHDDGDGPTVNTLQVHNPTNDDFMIPAGWIVGSNLLQVRTFNRTEHVSAGETILADVSCVEKGRWGTGQNDVDGGRAPVTVLGAGWDYDVESRLWRIDRLSRQHRVWNQVSRQEQRSGIRETNSLMQIMSEDSVTAPVPRVIEMDTRSSLLTHDQQNGFLVSAEGVPLMMEILVNLNTDQLSERAFANS
jgi:hypothetical protein